MNIFRNPVILLVLVLLAFLLFGANKLPKMARNMGQSMRILKSEVKEMKTEGKDKDANNSKTTHGSDTEDDVSAVEGTVIPQSETGANPDSKEQSSQ